MPPDDDNHYFRRIEEHFGRRRGGPLLLSPKDWRLIADWRDRGVPVEVVLRGINRAFDRFAQSRPSSSRVNSLSYCAQSVEETWEEYREAGGAAAQEKDEDEGDEARARVVRHIETAAAACGDAASRCTGGARDALEDASSRLRRLAAEVRDGGVGPDEIETSANRAESRLVDRLAECPSDLPEELRGLGDTPSEERRRLLDRLRIPRFSPFAA